MMKKCFFSALAVVFALYISAAAVSAAPLFITEIRRFIAESLAVGADLAGAVKGVRAESEDASLQLVYISSPAGRNQNATVIVRGQPYTEYSIVVMYLTRATAQGVTGENERKMSDSEGYVSWTWLVGGRTSQQWHYLTISGGGETLRVNFEVR